LRWRIFRKKRLFFFLRAVSAIVIACWIGLDFVWGHFAWLGAGAGDLRLCESAQSLSIYDHARVTGRLGSLSGRPRRLPRLCAFGRRILPRLEHSGALLHRLSRRRWHAASVSRRAISRPGSRPILAADGTRLTRGTMCRASAECFWPGTRRRRCRDHDDLRAQYADKFSSLTDEIEEGRRDIPDHAKIYACLMRHVRHHTPYCRRSSNLANSVLAQPYFFSRFNQSWPASGHFWARMPPKLVRLRTEFSTPRTAKTSSLIRGSMACISARESFSRPFFA